MREGRMIAVIVAVVLIILGVTIAVVSLSKVGWDFTGFNAGKSKEITYPVEESFRSIEVDVTTADIHVFRSPDDVCRVHIYEQERMPLRVDVKDGCLTIRQEDDRSWYDHIGIVSDLNSRVEIALPEAVYEELRLELTTGDVIISEEVSFRSVTVDLTTGDVDCKAQVAEELNIHTTTGDIYVAAGTSEAHITLRVTTGDVTVRDTVCETLEIKATTGDTRLELCDADTIQVRSTTGDVTGVLLRIKEFRTHTTTGDVDVPGDGSVGICDIRTTTGDIKIDIE